MRGRVRLALACAAIVGAGCGIKGPLTLPAQPKPAKPAEGADEGTQAGPAERKP